MRRQGKLPAKPKGYEHVYRLGYSFTEFFESLRPSPDVDKTPAPPPAGLLARLCESSPSAFGEKDAGNKYDRIRNGLKACDDAVLKELIAVGKLNQRSRSTTAGRRCNWGWGK